MAAVDLTANFYEYIDRLVLKGDVDLTHDELMQLAAHEESERAGLEIGRRAAATTEEGVAGGPGEWLLESYIEAELRFAAAVWATLGLCALALAGFTLMATFVALRFWEMPLGHERFMAANSFFEHLGLVGGFVLVAWLVGTDRYGLHCQVLHKVVHHRLDQLRGLRG